MIGQRKLWGEHGRFLVGYRTPRYHLATSPLNMERIGPFVPPISESGRMVVSDTLKQAIERDRPFPMRFRETYYEFVKRLDWHTWDFEAAMPQWMPSTGDPDDYYAELWPTGKWPRAFRMWCSRRLARRMEPSWELLPPVIKCNIERNADDGSYLVDLFGYDYRGVFYSSERQTYLLADGTAKDWLQKAAGEWAHFAPLKVRR